MNEIKQLATITWGVKDGNRPFSILKVEFPESGEVDFRLYKQFCFSYVTIKNRRVYADPERVFLFPKEFYPTIDDAAEAFGRALLGYKNDIGAIRLYPEIYDDFKYGEGNKSMWCGYFRYYSGKPKDFEDAEIPTGEQCCSVIEK